MKFKFLLLISICIFSISAKAQNAYYDAVVLKAVLSNEDLSKGKIALNKPVRDILVSYFGNSVPASNADQPTIDAFFTKNPFFRNPQNQTASIFAPQAAMFTFPFNGNGVLSSIGGLNVTNFADGLAKFLVKRFKEELTVAFFQKFKDALNTSPEFQTLFPQTFQVLLTIDKDIYQFSIYLNTLREAFIKDLTNLYVNFKKAEQLPSFQAFFNAHLEIKTVVFNAFYFIDQYANGVHPGQVIENYDADNNLFFTDPNLQLNIRSSIKVLQLISNSLRSQSANNYWVPADSAKLLLEKPAGLDLYFGLLYQKAVLEQPTKNYTFHTAGGDVAFSELLSRAYGVSLKLNEFKKQIEDIIDYAQEVNEYIASLKEKKKSEIDYNDYYTLFNSALDMLQKGLQINDLVAINIDADVRNKTILQVNKWIGVARIAGELYVDIRTKNYSSAIINVTNIIDSIWNSTNVDLRNKILKYGSFAAAIAQAKNSDEVEAVIESVALPAGSYSVKRESQSNISINAYVGAFGGAEYMPTLETKQTAFTAGLTAPVGVAFSWGSKKFLDGKKNPGGKSFTIFVPVIDIGALASFRLGDDKTNIAADIELKNIIAPGLYFYLGLGKCPISIGAGAQLGPQLRSVSEGTPTIDTKNIYIRYGLTVAVDIPLLNLHTSSK